MSEKGEKQPGEEYANWKAPETRQNQSQTSQELAEKQILIEQKAVKINEVVDQSSKRLENFGVKPDSAMGKEISIDVLNWIKQSIESGSRRENSGPAEKAATFYKSVADHVVLPHELAMKESKRWEGSKDYRDHYNRENASKQLGNEYASQFDRIKEAEQMLANYLVDRIKEDPDVDPKHLVAMQQIAESDEPNKASKIAYADAATNRFVKFGSGGGSYLPKS